MNSVTYFVIFKWILMLLVENGDSQDFEFAYSRCGDEYLFLPEAVPKTTAETTCQSRGYDGLAVIIKPYQIQDLNYIIAKVTSGLISTHQDALWIGLEYKGPGRYDWDWKRNGTWLNLTSEFNIPWNTGDDEPDNGHMGEDCVRVMISPQVSEKFFWRSFSCLAKRFPLCYRHKEMNEPLRKSKMLLFPFKFNPPTNKTRLEVRSLLECQVFCTCRCLISYYHSNTCYISQDTNFPSTGGNFSGYLKLGANFFPYTV